LTIILSRSKCYVQKFFLLGAASLAMIATNTFAADVSRVRLMVPIQASDAASYDAGQTQPDSVSASGYSLQYVHSSGVGIGYTSSTLKKHFQLQIKNGQTQLLLICPILLMVK
jgi:opacity protein-like surface antigen